MLKFDPPWFCIHVISSPWGCVTACSRGSVCVDVCYLKLVSFWLLANHNTGIVVEPVTPHTHTHPHTHTLTHACTKTWNMPTSTDSCMDLHTDSLACSCTRLHAYVSCGSCYYAILQVMNQSICLQSVLKRGRQTEWKIQCSTAQLRLLYKCTHYFSSLLAANFCINTELYNTRHYANVFKTN